jgi:4-hydroxybenzoate polyprenyltransferase
MMSNESPKLWKHIAKESIWGNRGLIKISSLFFPVSAILTFSTREIGHENVSAFFQISLVVASWMFLSILFNDIADFRDDQLSGKLRWINRFSPIFRVLIIVFFLGIGLGTPTISRSPISTVWIFLAAVVTGFFYSFKPLRLKERGIWGLFAYSLACTFGYSVIPWIWLSAKGIVLLLIAPAVFLDKWVNLHFHQVVDYESDFETGTKTYAVSVGSGKARNSLRWASSFASLWFLTVFLYFTLLLPTWQTYVFLAVVTVLLVSGFYIFSVRRSSRNATSLVRELSWSYLGFAYAVLRFFPLVLFIRLSLSEPSIWAVVAFVAFILIVESWFWLRYPNE